MGGLSLLISPIPPLPQHAEIDVENARRIVNGDMPSRLYPVSNEGFGTMSFEAVHAMGYSRIRRGQGLLDDFDRMLREERDAGAHFTQERGCTCSEGLAGGTMVECCSCQRWCHVECYPDFAGLSEADKEGFVFYCHLCVLDGAPEAPASAAGAPEALASAAEAPASAAGALEALASAAEAPASTSGAPEAPASASSWLPAAGLRAITGLQQIYSTPQSCITPESLRSIMQTVSVRARHGVLVSQT